MTLRTYLASKFEHSHEDEMFFELYKNTRELFNDKDALLIGNPTLSGKQFDAILFKENAITIIEMKDYSGTITGDENIIWKAVDEEGVEVEIKASGQSNPYLQVKNCKTRIWAYLENNLEDIFGHQKAMDMKEGVALGQISGIVLFRGPIIEDKTRFNHDINMWFDISDLRRIKQVILRKKAPKIKITDSELEKFENVILGGEKGVNIAKENFENLKKAYVDIEEEAESSTLKLQTSDIKDFEELERILNQNQYDWIREYLIPYIGMTYDKTKTGNGYFSRPLSQENIEQRIISLHSPYSPETSIQNFEKLFEGHIEKQRVGASYTVSKRCYHPPSRNPCSDPEKAETSYQISEELKRYSIQYVESLEIDTKKLVKEILDNVRTVKDYLALKTLQTVSDHSRSNLHFDFSSYNLHKELEFIISQIDIDEDFKEYILDRIQSEFELKCEDVLSILPSDKRSINLYTSHDFNTSSCYEVKSIYIHHKLANEIYNVVDEINLEKFLADVYKNIDSQLMINGIKNTKEEKLKLDFLIDNEHELIHKRGVIYDFLLHRYKQVVDSLIDKKILEKNEDEIKLKNEDRYQRLLRVLYNRNKTYYSIIINKWLNSELDLTKDRHNIKKISEPKIEKDQDMGYTKQETPKENRIILGHDTLPNQYGVIGRHKGKDVLLDLNAPHIVFVAGHMGAGKGYTIGNMVEMLASNSIQNISDVKKKATVIVLYKPRDDVKSEFWSIREKNDNPREIDSLNEEYDVAPVQLLKEEDFNLFLDPNVYSLSAKGFGEEYNTANISPIRLNPARLKSEDWGYALSIGGSSDTLYTKEIYKILRHLQGEDFTVEDIRREINASDLNNTQKRLAISRLEILEEYFGTEDFMEDLKIGGVNIFDFRKGMYQSDDIFSIMTLIISRLQNKKDIEDEPFVFVINEAHEYFKRGISKEFVDYIENLIRRKRHGANWLLLDTHLPEDVAPNIIKLSDMKIIHRMDKTVDSRIIRSIMDDTSVKLHDLDVGEAMICANDSNIGRSRPIRVKIRPRITKHGGETKTAI